MGRKKYIEKKKTEYDRNNVAFYKKIKNEEENPKAEVSPQSTTVTSTQTSEQSEKSKTWSQIAKAGLADRGPVKNQTARIKPVFNSKSVGYDRIVITLTHFNSKQFKGYISEKEADTISMAIGLKDLENHHGTSFYRNEDDMLFITFKTSSHAFICRQLTRL